MSFGYITKSVFEDKNISSTAKVAYAIITSLAKECPDGYCHITKEQFSKRIGLCERRAMQILSDLEQQGHIEVVVLSGNERKIKPCEVM